jgi:methylated-DNA-[protein]-cysteine S-methyltransferase
MKNYGYWSSPLGEFLLVSENGFLTELHLDKKHFPVIPSAWEESPRKFQTAIRQLDDYFSGKRQEFDLPLAPQGTPFQLKVWRELQRIPYGVTRSYGEIARRIRQPAAARAVGMANNRNPISIIIPCHRVIGAKGDLVGYGSGLKRKSFLLALEKGETVS